MLSVAIFLLLCRVSQFFIVMLSVVMLNVVRLSTIDLNVIMPSVVVLILYFLLADVKHRTLFASDKHSSLFRRSFIADEIKKKDNPPGAVSCSLVFVLETPVTSLASVLKMSLKGRMTAEKQCCLSSIIKQVAWNKSSLLLTITYTQT
jgi:hypothetical protein